MVAIVTFASAKPKEIRAAATLPVLLERMLKKWAFKKRFADQSVAIKMHLGGKEGYSTIHPFLVARVVRAVIEAGGKPFITDGAYAVRKAYLRGYTPEVIGAPLYPICGVADKYVYSKRVNYRTFKKIEMAGNIVDADAMIVLSHGKGHGNSGFGGAIKNIAMGCVNGATRGQIHRLTSDYLIWNGEKCDGCLLCRDNCPNDAITWQDGKINFDEHACKYCMHCQNACPTDSIAIDERGVRFFQHGMALSTREVLNTFSPGSVMYINVLLQVTPFCDCWGLTTPAIVPDIGIVASDDMIAIETASLDLIKNEDFIEGSLPAPLKRSGTGHLFEQIHGKDPALQIEECLKLKLGNPEYKLKNIR